MKATIILLTLIISGSSFAKGMKLDGGSNIGGGNNGSEYMATWCKDQSGLLRNYRDRALLKVRNTGDFNLANKILNDGIIQALKGHKGNNESFLEKSLTRGLEISRNLEATSATNSLRKAMVVNNILINYYNFILETVINNLDIGAYIPYIQSNADQMDERAAHFEENFVLYASTQLDWIISTLTAESVIGGKTIIVPVGDAKSLIKVAMILTQGTAEDLSDSLWNLRFSCAISSLQILNETITSYDQGNREMFDDEKGAVSYLAFEINRISRGLNLKASCN
jgi:hypothetical protein